MKLLVGSDTHGNIRDLARAVEREQPDLICHLGDYVRDGKRLQELFPHIPLEQVPGNCDFPATAGAERLLQIEGHTLLLCHGHTFGVKRSLLQAYYAAVERQAELLLFGHTHRALCQQKEGVLLFNPGTAGGRGAVCSYGVIELNQNTVLPRIVTMEEN